MEQQKPAGDGGAWALTGLVFACIAAISWIIPHCGAPAAILGLICSLMGRSSSRKKVAVAGIWISAASLVLTAAVTAIGLYLASTGQVEFFQ